MPDITGTSSADNIDVTNDDGTLNGVPQGNPIDNIAALGGADTITINTSTITGNVNANAGRDDITISGSTVGQLNAGRGADTVTVQGSSFGNIRLGNQNDTLDFRISTVSGTVNAGGGTDTLNVPEGTIVNDATFGTFTVQAGSAIPC
ncbi:MAG: hypothetical protein AB3N15_02175 [Paracoccaceae bacterium]